MEEGILPLPRRNIEAGLLVNHVAAFKELRYDVKGIHFTNMAVSPIICVLHFLSFTFFDRTFSAATTYR
jgi:hypothetical protein